MLSFFPDIAYPHPAPIVMPRIPTTHLAAREMEKCNVILGGRGAQLILVLFLWGRVSSAHSRTVGKNYGTWVHCRCWNSEKTMLLLQGKCCAIFAT